MTVYAPSTVKTRVRRTNVQLDAIDAAIMAAAFVEYGLPTRPTKHTDSRSRNFTGESVEVDAIPATILRQLVNDAITQHIDPDRLRITRRVEQSERDMLLSMVGGAA